MFELRFDRDTRVNHIRMEGFWTPATMAAFSAALLAKNTALHLVGNCATLVDLRQFPVQSSEVTNAIEAMMKRASAIFTAPIVAVTGSALTKFQTSRVLKADNIRVFLDWDEANAWLDSAWPSRRAA